MKRNFKFREENLERQPEPGSYNANVLKKRMKYYGFKSKVKKFEISDIIKSKENPPPGLYNIQKPLFSPKKFPTNQGSAFHPQTKKIRPLNYKFH